MIYEPMQENLTFQLNKLLASFGFTCKHHLLRGLLFENQKLNTTLIIDHKICDSNYPFSYTE